MKASQSIGQYVLYRNPTRLTEGSRTVNLTPRQLDVLTVLVDAHGEVVTREALLERVWRAAFVEPGNLNQTIFLIRRTLGKLANGGEYVESVPRQGYRIAPFALKTESPALDRNPTPSYLQAASGSLPDAELYRLLVESIEDYAIYMLDCGGRILTWNSGVEHNKGYRAEEVLGQHFSLFFTPEDIEAHVPDRELARALKEGRSTGEGWRIRKNGDRFWASFVLSSIRGEGGKLLGFAKVVRDLTPARRQQDSLLRMEALLRRERDTLNAAMESSLDAVFVCEAVRDASGEIEDFIFTYLNSNVEKMVAIPRQVLLRGKMCELLPINRHDGFFEAYRRVVETGAPYVAERPVRSQDVSSEWLRIRAVRLGDGVVITASDITEQKRLEAEVARLEAL
jgi:PAS domain S-box-containing protein